jgi:peroxiredoxin Q/BCP
VRVVGVSTDSLASHTRFRQKYGLTFPLLSDPERRVLEAYGAWGEMAGAATPGALRSTVVVDERGLVARVYARVRAKGHARAVLEDLAE